MERFENLTTILENHKSRCRLCIAEVDEAQTKFLITREIRSMILQLQIEVILTKRYSNFICSNCHRDMQLLSSFRRKITEKQCQLSTFLCRTSNKHDKNRSIKGFENPSFIKVETDPIALELSIIKSEKFEDENPYKTISVPLNHEEPNEETSTSVEKSKKVQKTKRAQSKKDKVSRNRFKKSENFQQVENNLTTYQKLNQSVPCPECAKVVKVHSLRGHINRIHRKLANYTCDFCGKTFFTITHLAIHIKTHIPKEFLERNHKCDKCPKTYCSKEGLSIHKKNMHGSEQTWKCDCGKVFNNQWNLYCHKKAVHMKEKFQKTCEICGKVLANISYLKKHIRIFHTEGGRGNFMCSDCGKRYDDLTGLNKHRKSHMEKTFVCDEPKCDKKFVSSALLQNHKNFSHLKLRPFACNVKNCDKAFSSKQQLQQHDTVSHKKHKSQ